MNNSKQNENKKIDKIFKSSTKYVQTRFKKQKQQMIIGWKSSVYKWNDEEDVITEKNPLYKG